MIKQLKPDIIEKNWKGLARIISACLPPKNHLANYATNAIKTALAAGDMQCWSITKDSRVTAVALTAVHVDKYVGARALMVYGLYTTKKFNKELWQEWMSEMEKFAKLKDCYNVVSIRRIGR